MTLNSFEAALFAKRRAEEERDDPVPGSTCDQCGRPMNPGERILGPVCGRCCRRNHREVAGR